MRLAKALGCQVEELFWLEQDLPQIEAVLTKPVNNLQQLRVSLARVGGQWIAYPLVGKDAFRPQLRVQYKFANSMTALHNLCRGEAHIAGMHLYDVETGEYNTPFVRKVLVGKEAVIITLRVWEEGLMVQAGNPKQIKSITDVVEMGAVIANREVGSGSRSLLEQTLQQEKIPFQSLQGFEWIMNSHQEVGWAIASDMVDAGISTASVAIAFGLGFIPLRHSRYDLVILKEYMQEPSVQQLLGTLGHRLVHSQLEVLGGYDISQIGAVVATI